MLVKFLPHGKGSAKAAVEYLVGERDAAGHEREGVEVLRGNPDMVAAVADSLDFERKYTSAVIAWALEDKPTSGSTGIGTCCCPSALRAVRHSPWTDGPT